MGRPPSNGGPSFRFNPTEVAEMESLLQAHSMAVPPREILEGLAQKFSNSAERSGKVVVQMKQVWNWFQNRRYALRAKAAKPTAKLNVSPIPRDDSAIVRHVPQVPQSLPAPSATVRTMPQAPQTQPAPSVQPAVKNGSDSSQMEFEAKSARDGAWYDVASFLSHRSLETGDPEVLVRFAGFGQEEDEWINVRKHVRQRSLPCESSECVAVLPGDLILCFQEGKEQALYFDAHVLDAQRRRHDVRGCRCRFLVRYDHDQSEEIVPLRKVCRRPETDYRMQQLHAETAAAKKQKTGSDPPTTGNTLRVYPPAETMQKQPKAEPRTDIISAVAPVKHTNFAVATESKVLPPNPSESSTLANVGTAPKVLPPNPSESTTLANVGTAVTTPVNVSVGAVADAGNSTSSQVNDTNVGSSVSPPVNIAAGAIANVGSSATPAVDVAPTSSGVTSTTSDGSVQNVQQV